MMKNICFLLAVLLSGCATTPPFQSVPPGAKFELLGAVVQSPAEPDWYLISVNQVTLALGKRFPTRSESLIAGSNFMTFEFAGNDEEYLNQIKSQRETNDDKARFSLVSSINEIIPFKGTHCLSYKTISVDHGAKGVIGKAVQYLKNVGMICRHPSNKVIAIQIEVSHRSPDKEFPESLLPVANQFIQSLELVNNAVR